MAIAVHIYRGDEHLLSSYSRLEGDVRISGTESEVLEIVSSLDLEPYEMKRYTYRKESRRVVYFRYVWKDRIKRVVISKYPEFDTTHW